MTPTGVTSAARPYWRLVADPLTVLAIGAAIGLFALRRPELSKGGRPARPGPVSAAAAAAPPPVWAPGPDETTQAPVEPPPTPEPDRAAIARAEADLDAARGAREQAERRAREAEDALRAAQLDAANAALAAKTLAAQIRNPRSRIASIQARGGVLMAETDRLKAELTSMARTPRPRRKVLSDRTPVARAVDGKEYHFEVRGRRVAFIDLERLVDKLEADARLQIRLAMGGSRPIRSTVGPVGAFSLEYELGPASPDSIEGLLGRSVSYDLVGWEVVPRSEVRGETLEAIQHPASEFMQVLNTLNPSRATITLWIYPDAFGTYRRLLGILHARGFTVAARPLPAGIAIRGSPTGSLSAGQ